MKKLISLLLVVCLMMSISVGAFAATWTLEADPDAIYAGEDVTVTVHLDEAMPATTAVSYILHYDSSLFTLKSFASGDTGAEMSLSQALGDAYAISFVDTTSEGVDLQPGTVCTLVFTARADVAGEEYARFDLEFSESMDTTWTLGSHNAGERLEVSIQECSVPASGYYVSLTEDSAVQIGEAVSLTVTVDSEEESHYNAYYLTVDYDESVLTYTGTETGIVNDEANGILTIAGYGEDRACQTDTIPLPFEAAAIGEALVSVTAAHVDKKANANLQDAPVAEILGYQHSVTVTVGGYTVSLPEDFSGEGSVAAGEDYGFEAIDKNYDYVVKATVDGSEITVTDNGDGSFTIPADQMTGNVVVETVSKAGKTFAVTLGTDMSGEAQAQYMSDYTAKLSKADGYQYEVSVRIGGESYSGYSVSGENYTIPGKDITGDVVFTVSKALIPPSSFSVSFEGTGAGDASGAAEAAVGQDYHFTLNKAEGYTYTVSAAMGGQTVEMTEAEGVYTIARVSGTLVITVEKSLAVSVEAVEYVQLDGKSLFLITASGVPADVVLGYEGSAMYWSDKYEAYAWMLISDKTLDEVLADAELAVAQLSAEKISVTYDGDVNETGLVDVNDAQLVYNMYNAVYDSFDGENGVSILRFLKADGNGSRNLTVEDAAAIVNQVLNP